MIILKHRKRGLLIINHEGDIFINSCKNFSKKYPVLFAVAAVHSLDDFMIFVATNIGNDAGSNYVSSTDIVRPVIGYTVFTLILVPTFVRCIRNLNSGEAIPFDEDFLPREVVLEKKSKNKK